jgi:hypothetical protein
LQNRQERKNLRKKTFKIFCKIIKSQNCGKIRVQRNLKTLKKTYLKVFQKRTDKNVQKVIIQNVFKVMIKSVVAIKENGSNL